jgi:hypothetical protein
MKEKEKKDSIIAVDQGQLSPAKPQKGMRTLLFGS